MQKTIKCRGSLVSLDTPKIMGILNLTPDSFYDGGFYNDKTKIFSQVEKMLSEGADFVDMGAMTTNHGAKLISTEEELQRLIPILKDLVQEFPQALFSIDTFRAEVAKQSIENGASLINDVSGGNLDSKMFETIAKLKCPYVLMHMRGTPETMDSLANYENLTIEIIQELVVKIEQLVALNVSDIIIDPGFGFSKTVAQNFELLRELDIFKKIIDLPILVGVSRKSMIWRTLNITASEALNGTTALNMIALEKGSNILRVHDVKEAKETIALFKALKN